MTPPDDMRDALRRCARGALSANMTLMRLCIRMPDAETARKAIDFAIEEARGSERQRLRALDSLWRETPDAFRLVKAVIGTERRPSRIESDDLIADWAATFDDAAAISPAASVALYSLGREDLLDAATREVASYLENERLFDRDASILDIGCGSGRFAAALASSASRMVGIDISESMLARARQRCEGRGHAEFFGGDGRSFPFLHSESFDVALAIDVFPYLVEAGQDVVRSNLTELHRVLRPKGKLTLVNYSYRGDMFDRAEIRALAAATGFELTVAGRRPFHSWDGAVFALVRK